MCAPEKEWERGGGIKEKRTKRKMKEREGGWAKKKTTIDIHSKKGQKYIDLVYFRIIYVK